MSYVVISTAVETKKTEISNDEANEMRKEYLSIVNEQSLTFIQKKQSIYEQIVEPVYKLLNVAATSNTFIFHIIDKVNNKTKKIITNSKLVCFGRENGNDVYLSDDTSISRLHGYLFIAKDQIIVLDIWSFLGTATIQRSNNKKDCLSTLPSKRNILLFDKNEMIHLNIANAVDILIIPENADKNDLKSFEIYKYTEKCKMDNDYDTKQNDSIKDMIDDLWMQTYRHLLQMGFEDDASLNAAKTFPNDLNGAINVASNYNKETNTKYEKKDGVAAPKTTQKRVNYDEQKSVDDDIIQHPNIMDTKKGDKLNESNHGISAEESSEKQFFKLLQRIKMEKYFDLFKNAECCDMESIEDLDDDILEKVVGIKKKMPRKRLLTHCGKTLNDMNKFKNGYGINEVLHDRLGQFGIVTLNILCNEIKNKNDLKNKYKIINDTQRDLLWNLIQKYENQNEYQQEGV